VRGAGGGEQGKSDLLVQSQKALRGSIALQQSVSDNFFEGCLL
jgi:hypothetical protein